MFQIGPGIVYLTYDSLFGKGAYLQSLTPVEPLVQKMIHQVWFEWYVPPVVAKFFLLAEAMMVSQSLLLYRQGNTIEGIKPCFDWMAIITHFSSIYFLLGVPLFILDWGAKFESQMDVSQKTCYGIST